MRTAPLSFVLALLVVSSADLARADWVANAPASCRGITPTQIPAFTPYASNGNDTYSFHFVCPLSLNAISATGINVSGVGVTYNDVSSTDAFYCWTEFTSYAGDHYVGTAVYTCSTDGGCADNSGVSYTGMSHLLLNVPTGGVWVDDSFAVHCVVPKKTSGGQMSGIVLFNAG
jgi:hypothetical protein